MAPWSSTPVSRRPLPPPPGTRFPVVSTIYYLTQWKRVINTANKFLPQARSTCGGGPPSSRSFSDLSTPGNEEPNILEVELLTSLSNHTLIPCSCIQRPTAQNDLVPNASGSEAQKTCTGSKCLLGHSFPNIFLLINSSFH